MYVVEIFLPLADNGDQPFAPELYRRETDRLTGAFGGLTAYVRAPAEGYWLEGAHAPGRRDDLVIFEVMTEQLDRRWWLDYRQALESLFRQEQIVIRAVKADRL